MSALLILSVPLKADDALLLPMTPRLGHLAGGAATTFATAAGRSDYVTGTLRVNEGRFDLDLVTPGGAHLRRLAEDATGAVDFRYVEGEEPGHLKLTARGDGDYRLEILQRLPVTEQIATADPLPSPQLTTLAADLSQGGTTEAFWSAIEKQGTPLIEDAADGQKIVTFLARGAKRNVRLFGAPSGDHEELQRLGDSDVWFKSFVVPNDTRLSYQLAFDVPDVPGTARDRRIAILATAKADPLNRHPWPAEAIDAYRQESVLELADAPAQPWLADHDNRRGSLSSFDIESGTLGNRRTIILYRPVDFDPADPDTLLLFVFDASEYMSKVPLPAILDAMIAAKAIPPVVAVFIPNPDRETRARELPGNDDFADFMAGDLLPRVLKETGMAARPVRTLLAGSSYGGLAAATVALRHPESFGNVLSLSGSFWWSPAGTPRDRQEYVAATLAEATAPKLRFFLSAGLFESGPHQGTAGILETNRHLRDILVAKGVPVSYREYAGGHDYLVWRGAISDGLIALFGR